MGDIFASSKGTNSSFKKAIVMAIISFVFPVSCHVQGTPYSTGAEQYIKRIKRYAHYHRSCHCDPG
jgi:putative Mn2+ efflux pump MntP